MRMPAGQPRGTLQDSELLRLAGAGDGWAFAELYDRHERRVYGFCMRLLGTPHDAADATQETFVRMLARLPALEGREVNFMAYALATSRNACYDMIEGRRRAEPVAEQPERSQTGQGGAAGGGWNEGGDSDVALDPERTALLASARADVRAANAALPPRQREVLALREVELLSYDEIGEIMGLKRNAVAQLVSRARINLRDLLRGSALASMGASSADCTRALPLLAQLQDGEAAAGGDGTGEFDWLRAHLEGCDTCRLGREAMEEAGASYRALAPIVPLAWLRHATIARAAEYLGVDWSEMAGTAPAGSPREGPRARREGSRAGRRLGRGEAPRARGGLGRGEAPRARRRLGRGVLVGATVGALCVLLAAIVGIARDGHVQRLPLRQSIATTTTTTPTAILTPAQRGDIAKARVVGHAKIPDVLHAPADGTGIALATPQARTPQADTLHGKRLRVRAHHRRTKPARRTAPKAKSPQPPPSTTPAPAAPAPATSTVSTTSTSTSTQTTTTVATRTVETTSSSSSSTTGPGGGLIP